LKNTIEFALQKQQQIGNTFIQVIYGILQGTLFIYIIPPQRVYWDKSAKKCLFPTILVENKRFSQSKWNSRI